jgi:hypothetical protein
MLVRGKELSKLIRMQMMICSSMIEGQTLENAFLATATVIL